MATDFPAHIADGYEDTEVREYTPGRDATEPFIPGDLVFYDTTPNEVELCGADPALIAGISEVDSEAARLLTPNAKVPVRIIKGPRATLALSSATTPLESHIGDQYGITRTAGGHWRLDVAKTGADARVLVKRVDILNGIFFCQVLNDQLQFGTVA